ncbi:hypothetical protein GS597_02480 [Synechococcales cyanobacterium C]|uniref:Uncharacterized protein n=1 Tax=Petrachloros mirabilis ULC683 TaxID=2781853 RepID=A0A8K1ZWI3_9CYAN|nr:hypothetical protein [Petrachloros mirabilis]NCJ05397.1 hypothetical protein [Petrachloros mirabilis ULC683]
MAYFSKHIPSSGHQPLSYEEVYVCPVCRHGQLSGLTLMDAMACDFCRHIFTLNLEQQVLRIEDSAQAATWRWTGRGWVPTRRHSPDLLLGLWIFATALLVMPGLLVWLSYQVFPPLPSSRGAWLPGVWILMTFASHGAIALWLLCEYYQFSVYVSAKIQLQRALGRG